jgi:hypothetical protein
MEKEEGGTKFSAPCPGSRPKSNRVNFSFHVDGRFRCFSCPVRGRGAIDLVLALKHCGFQQAVSVLSGLQKFAPPTRQVSAPLPEAPSALVSSEKAPFEGTYEKFAVPSAWLLKRRLNDETCKRYEVFEYNNSARRSTYNGTVMVKIRRYSDGGGDA